LTVAEFKEHDVVRLLETVEADGDGPVMQGSSGTIVHIYGEGEAYAVEFIISGTSMKVATVKPFQIASA